MKLVEAIHILCSTQITEDQLIKADDLLRAYVEEFESNYGEQNMLFNVHLLLHTVQCVRKNGPLWTCSNYAFEDYIGVLARSVLGPTDIVSQITGRYLMKKSLDFHLQTSSEPVKIYHDTIQHKHFSKTWKYANFLFVGNPNTVTDPIVYDLIQNEMEMNIAEEISAYRAVFVDDKVFYETAEESEKYKTHDAFVCNPDLEIYAEIKFIIKAMRDVFFVINNKYKLDESMGIKPYIYRLIEKEDDLRLIRPSVLDFKYAFVKTDKIITCAKFPNLYERN